MDRIVPCLWFDMNCEEAVNYYIDTFNNAPYKRGESKIISVLKYDKGMETPNNDQMLGKILTAVFTLDGYQFMALDGGPTFNFTEAVSFNIDCENQAEIDYFTAKLSAFPENEQCGWVKDKFGVSWQIVPKSLMEWLGDADKERVNRVMNALLEMKKLDVAGLDKAFKGE
jgi:predicted 3-demethylubiquinone-9 3-methyltransferase (glyoxalase superfamily)